MRKIFILLFSLGFLNTFSQKLHPLEPSQNHYASLEKLNSKPNPQYKALDTLRFPASKYHPTALLYMMASPYYLNQEQIKELKQFANFPANSSEQTRAELDFLLEWQRKRTKADEFTAAKVLAPIGYWPHLNLKTDHEKYEQNRKDLFFIGQEVLGKECTIENYPATGKLLAGLTTDMRIMEFTVKYHLLRTRPYELEPKLKPLAIMLSPSFASGHTLWAYILSFTWSELLPEKRKAFLAMAYEIGESREIMGIHYPSDDEASRILAHKMLTAMWNNPKFQTDLANAKKEW